MIKETMKEKEASRRPSIDISNLDPSTFKEQFLGFNKEDYSEVLKANNEFLKVGYAKYIESVKKGRNKIS